MYIALIVGMTIAFWSGYVVGCRQKPREVVKEVISQVVTSTGEIMGKVADAMDKPKKMTAKEYLEHDKQNDFFA
jgi:hypothetical protein